jgi:hypothetical protein
MRARLAAAVAAALLSARAPCGATQEAPAGVVKAFFKAVAEERWRDAARYLDVSTFDRYRRAQVAYLRQARPGPQLAVEDLLRIDPDMPREVAEYEVRRMAQRRHGIDDELSREFAGVTSVDTLAAMSADDAAARWLQAKDFRLIVRRELQAQRDRGCRIPAGAENMLPPAPAPELLGAVVLDSAAYVIVRDGGREPGGDPFFDVHAEGPRVIQLRRVRDQWRILARADVATGQSIGFSTSDDCPPPRRQRPPR